MTVFHQGGILKDAVAGFFICPDCLILALGCSLWDMDLAMRVSGKFAKGLVVSGAAVCTRLLSNSGTLCLNIWA